LEKSTESQNEIAQTITQNGPEVKPAASAMPENSKPTNSMLASITRRSTRRSTRTVSAKDKSRSILRRPHKTEWIRTREGWQTEVIFLEHHDEQRTYLISVDVAESNEIIASKCTEGTLLGAINLDGDVFLLPVKDGDSNWASSLAGAIEESTTNWVQIQSNRAEGMYEHRIPDEPVAEPVWPDKSWDDVLAASLTKDLVIDSVDHPIIQRILHARM
jgi:hypothetical protein